MVWDVGNSSVWNYGAVAPLFVPVVAVLFLGKIAPPQEDWEMLSAMLAEEWQRIPHGCCHRDDPFVTLLVGFLDSSLFVWMILSTEAVGVGVVWKKPLPRPEMLRRWLILWRMP